MLSEGFQNPRVGFRNPRLPFARKRNSLEHARILSESYQNPKIGFQNPRLPFFQKNSLEHDQIRSEGFQIPYFAQISYFHLCDPCPDHNITKYPGRRSHILAKWQGMSMGKSKERWLT